MSDWIDVPAADVPAPKADDGWVDVPSSAAPLDPDVAKNVFPNFGPVLQAFGHGAKEGWGDGPTGLSTESVKWLSDKGIFGPEKGGYQNPFQAGNELVAHTLVGAFQIAAKAGSAALGAYQEGMSAVGDMPGSDVKFWKDAAAMPEAFFGSPHPTGIPKELPAGAEAVPHETPGPPVAEPGAVPPPIAEARDLGVIGPLKPDMTDASPAEKAAAEVPPPKIAAAARADDSISGPAPGEPTKAGNIRLDQIGINADAKDVILDAAKNNDDFNQARQGNVPLAQVESLSGASGVPSETLTGNDGLGRLMHNDAVVRTWLQAFHQASDEIAVQMETVSRTGDETDVAKLRDMTLRFQHMQEQVSGLTAEAGRTLGVFREFYENKGKAEAIGKLLEDNPGLDADSLKKLADTGRGLNDPAQLARYLHDSRQPTFWDKYLYYWTNALISGPVTHAKYIGANAAFGAYEAGVVTPIAGVLGAARRLAGGTDGVYVGEAAARTWGLLAGTPDAIKAAWTAAKNNVMTPFENEVAGKQVNPLTQTRPNPIGGKLGFALGIPGRSAAGIHSFFRFLGYRAEIEAQAYRQAAKEGYSPVPKAPEPVPVTAEQLRSGRAKPESDYHMSTAAIMNPEPYHAFKEMADHLADDVNSKFQVHGLLTGDRDANLKNLLDNGIDPNREFHSGNPRGGTHGVDSTRTFGAPYLLLSDEGEGLRQTGVKNVVANGPAEANIPALRAAYPNVNFMTSAEAERFMTSGERPAGPAPSGGSDSFWQRYQYHAANPTDAMMNAGIDNGNHLTFIGEQGSFGKLMSTVANFSPTGKGGIQPFKLILPFTHIPGQILRAGLEQTPAAFLDSKMRADLLGQNGAVKADTARARLIAGGAVSAMVANWAVNDTVTGYGPTDPTERAQWLRTHEPYSVRLGGWWCSYNKFGPIGDLVGLVSNLVEVGPKVADGEYADAAGHIMKATSRMLEDEVGMQGLVNLIDAMDDPDRKMGRFVSGQAASNLPYSSLLRQGASVTDPYMREAKTFVDQLRYAVPWARQDLLPKRDWLGAPMTNPGYGSIIRQRAVNDDPVDLAVSQLRGFRPAPPQDRVGGVKLPPRLYDEYQTTAGAFTRASLEPVVGAPGWGEIPPGIREQIVHSMVENARKTAGSMLQAKHPELIMQGVQDRQDKINGVKPTKLQ